MVADNWIAQETIEPLTSWQVRGVLFDRDGVLTFFDTDAATAHFHSLLPISLYEIAARWQAYGADKGFPHTLVEERHFFASFWGQLADKFSLPQAQRAILESTNYANFIKPYPEVRTVLSTLRSHHIRLGVLSNFSLASLEQSLSKVSLASYFDTFCAAPIIGAAKPSPMAYEIALRSLQIQPEQCLYFDDELECVEGRANSACVRTL